MTAWQVHFHEIGALDTVTDIYGVCLAIYTLSPDNVIVSPIRLGSGQIRCAHGILPVPAPAMAYLPEGIPCYAGEFEGESCTPAGAALLRYFGRSFGPMPAIAIRSIGYGIGKKAFPAAYCVRAFLGEACSGANAAIVELCCTTI